MSWREQQAANSVSGQGLRGSFRAATFVVPADDLQFGRRTEAHEFPLRDTPYIEDLGRAARRFTVEVFVSGPDYMVQRDALIAELEKPGPGLLTHPFYGILNVTAIDQPRVRQSSREGGKATFTITFIEAGENIFPTAVTATAASVDAAADVAVAAAKVAFLKRFNVSGLPGWGIVALEDKLAGLLSGLLNRVGAVTNTIAAAIRAPANMAGLIVGSIQQIQTMFAVPFEALRLYKTLFSGAAGGAAATTATLTSTIQRQQAIATVALQEFIGTLIVIEACRAASRVAFVASDDAVTARDDLLAEISLRIAATDPILLLPIESDLFDALLGLRAAVVQDIRVRGAKLPRIQHYTPTAVLPAHVLAHKIFGDATRAEEIIARNRVKHPGFVPAGSTLEVLTNA